MISIERDRGVLHQLIGISLIYGIILLFNLGGFFTSFFALNIFYIIVPVSIAIALLVKRYSSNLLNSTEFKLYFFFLFSYLVVSLTSFYVVSYDEQYDIVYNLRTFAYSIINIYIFYKISVIFHYFRLFDRFLILNVLVLLFAMILTALFPYFNLVPLDYTKASDSLMSLTHSYNIRLTGYYLNPNLTGYIANIALVFGMTYFIFNKRLNLLAILLFVVSLYISIRSFSKTSIIITFLLLLLFAIFLLANKKFWFSKIFFERRLIFLILLVCGIYLLFESSKWYKNLDEGQRQRIDQVVSILFEQKINNQTTTHRSDIWQVGLDKFLNSPIIGNGYGSFEYFSEEGQGIHNMYLKIFGEAGIIIGVIYLFVHLLLFRIMYFEYRLHYRFLLLGLIIVTLVFNFSNHNAFHTSIISYVYGIILSFSCQYKEN